MVYVSAAVRPFSQADLRNLLAKARSYNGSVEITGLLLYHSQSFFQILEGQEEVVAPLYARIQRDPRHDRLMLLSKTIEEERSFGAWSMGFVDLDLNSIKHPGFVKMLEANSSFLDLQGDSKLVARLIDGFQEGQWRQSIV